MVVSRLLLFVAEEKRRNGQLGEAILDLQNKVKHGIPALFCGGVSAIPGYAAAGCLFQFVLISTEDGTVCMDVLFRTEYGGH